MSHFIHRHPSAVLVVAGSLGAGSIHAAAAGSHSELRLLPTLFAIAAVLQIGWGVVAVVRESRWALAVGIAINGVAAAAWLANRLVGISAIEGLASGQAMGLQDGMAVGLEVLVVVAGSVALVRHGSPRRWAPVAPVFAALVLVAAVPAMATPHAHSGEHHEDAGHEDAGHDDVAHGDGGHHDEPASDAPTEVALVTDADLGYPASFVGWLDTAESPAARARAQRLVIATNAGMERYPDEASLVADGYTSIGDGSTGWEHYIHVGRIADDRVLDPSAIESVVLKVNDDGTKEVASAMYLLGFGTTMDDVPDIAGELTAWHDHQNLCWEGARVVGTTRATGKCERGALRATQPMLHVWVTDHECGPFAGIEGSHGGGCAGHEH
ncbi:MAG: hypothetical protein JJE52_04885 [Acidimicrobiia bacterium]|nr:hypothetical protein [Acidimicrobiia bacterium]